MTDRNTQPRTRAARVRQARNMFRSGWNRPGWHVRRVTGLDFETQRRLYREVLRNAGVIAETETL